MSVQIIVDSAADFEEESIRRYGLMVVPLKTIFSDGEYVEGETITRAEFYQKLKETGEIPKTCQAAPYDFEQKYQTVLDAGDTAVVITISGKLSGTAQSARIAAEDYENQIFVVDSENATIGEQILALRALELRDAGYSAAEIAEALEREKKDICLCGIVDKLDYLQKGGRLSKTAAVVGGLLSVKPVLALVDGVIIPQGKARGSKQGNNLLTQLIEKNGGVDFSRPIRVAYSGTDDSLLNQYITDSRVLWEGKVARLERCTIGCTIGTQVGPGVIVVAFFHA